MGISHATSSPNWPDLPPDLASLILCRLTSQADHLSFWAVCRDWRHATQQQRGTTPWLNLGPGVYQSIADGTVHRFSRCHGTSGCWILFYHDPDVEEDDEDGDGGGCLFLSNPFHPSAAPIQIPWPYREPSKIIICSSSVVILHRGICKIVPSSPADMSGPHQPWRQLTGYCGEYADMCFYLGRIFTVTHFGELFSHDLLGYRREYVMNQSIERNQPVNNIVRHLVVSADNKKLLMVRWSIPRRKLKVRRSNPHEKATAFVVYDHRWATNLHVFEADLAKDQWSEVKDLGGQVLFVGRSSCRAFGSLEHCHPRFPQGNLVYILGVDWHMKRDVAGADPCGCNDCRDRVNGDIPSYSVYDMTTGTLSLVSLGGGPRLGSARSEWFFPCE